MNRSISGFDLARDPKKIEPWTDEEQTSVFLNTLCRYARYNLWKFVENTLGEIVQDEGMRKWINDKFSCETEDPLDLLDKYIEKHPDVAGLVLEAASEDMIEIYDKKSRTGRLGFLHNFKAQIESGEFKSFKRNKENKEDLLDDYCSDDYKLIHEFNYGANTTRWFDSTKNTLYYAESSTVSGENADNAEMFTAVKTKQNDEAIVVREWIKHFESQGLIPKHDKSMKTVETGYSKGGHKALFCFLEKVTQEIIDIANDKSCDRNQKRQRIENVFKKNKCCTVNAPCLSQASLDYFLEKLQPVLEKELILRAEAHLQQSLNITRINIENDPVSGINEHIAIGKEKVIKHTRYGLFSAHAIELFFDANCKNKDSKYTYIGDTSPVISSYAPPHIAARDAYEILAKVPEVSRYIKVLLVYVEEYLWDVSYDVNNNKQFRFDDQENKNDKKLYKEKNHEWWWGAWYVTKAVFMVGPIKVTRALVAASVFCKQKDLSIRSREELQKKKNVNVAVLVLSLVGICLSAVAVTMLTGALPAVVAAVGLGAAKTFMLANFAASVAIAATVGVFSVIATAVSSFKIDLCRKAIDMQKESENCDKVSQKVDVPVSKNDEKSKSTRIEEEPIAPQEKDDRDPTL